MYQKKYLALAEHYEKVLDEHGDSTRGMDWPREDDQLVRFGVMTDLFRSHVGSFSLLDFACGSSLYYPFVANEFSADNLTYSGIDISQKSIAMAKRKFPGNEYLCCDILASEEALNEYDFIVINGLFTQKGDLSDSDMTEFMKAVLSKIFPSVRRGLAFNTMSDTVDFRKPGAYHADTKMMLQFVYENLSKRYVLRNDYGLYESTLYVYK